MAGAPTDPTSEPDTAHGTGDPPRVERAIEVRLPADEVWELLVDGDELGAWFGGPSSIEPEPGGTGTFTDPDGTRRDARVDIAEPGRRLAWTWWPDGGSEAGPREIGTDTDTGGMVDVRLTPVEHGTRITVVERPAPAGVPSASMCTAALPLVDLEFRALVRSTHLVMA